MSTETEVLKTAHDLTYTWKYDSGEKHLRRLYEIAKRDQWNGADLPWQTDVDPEQEHVPDAYIGIYGSELWNALTPAEVRKLRVEMTSWMLSQFMHGEQGALMSTAQLVTAVPSAGAKLYGATQVMDEARHLEVFHRYTSTKVGRAYPPNPHLRTMLDAILTDSRWDLKYLGMQIMLEGLALASFGLIKAASTEPLLVELITRVMRDESRHVAFGVLSLREYYREMPERDRREREDFLYEGARLMRDRFMAEEVWEAMGLPVARCLELVTASESMQHYRMLLFSRLVPNLKQLGLLSERMRARFDEMGVLSFEDLPADGLEEAAAAEEPSEVTAPLAVPAPRDARSGEAARA